MLRIIVYYHITIEVINMKNVNNKEIKEAGKDESGYNGYTNYETWLICLNIDNDEDLYNDVRRAATESSKTHDNYEVGREIKEYLEEWFWNEECETYRISDSWTVRDWKEINWTEVAETRLEVQK